MDAERKRQLKAQAKAQERASFIASFPLPADRLRELFEYLDRDDAPPCRHTLQDTESFLSGRSIAPDSVVPWLLRHGGGCDCEVVLNVYGAVGEALGWDIDA